MLLSMERSLHNTGGNAAVRSCRARLSQRQTAVLLGRWGSMLRSGIPPDAALERLARRRDRSGLVAAFLREQIAEGRSVAEAMGALPRVFSPLAVAMCHAGEASGRLPEAMEGVSALLEERGRRTLAFQIGLIYPVIVLVVGMGLITFLMLFVLPRFVEMLDSLDAPLPAVTRSLMATSHGVVRYGPVAMVALVLLWVGFGFLSRTLSGRVLSDWVRLHAPLSRGFVRRVVSTRFARVYAQLLASGVQVGEAVRLSGAGTGNLIAEQVMVRAREGVATGIPLSEAMGDDRIFLPDLKDALETGEASGQTDELLTKLADRLDHELKQIMMAWAVIPGVLILLLLGVFVGWIVLAVLVPWFQLPGLL
jgi:type II secretory pathway component PulF